MKSLTKNEHAFCGEMETGMEKTMEKTMEQTMEQIRNLLERATPDQQKLILRLLRSIIK